MKRPVAANRQTIATPLSGGIGEHIQEISLCAINCHGRVDHGVVIRWRPLCGRWLVCLWCVELQRISGADRGWHRSTFGLPNACPDAPDLIRGEPMKIVYRMPGGTVPAQVDLLSAGAIGTVARAAEAAGWAGVCFDEHPIPPQYWREGPDGHDSVDPFVALATVAGATERIRLVVYATIVPIRNPFLLAKSVATLDVISGGRVDLGMAAGYLPEEFDALGISFGRRNDDFDESIKAMKLAWSGEPVNVRTERFNAVDVCAHPRPVQRPHPPLWVGGNSGRALRRVVESGAGWMALVNPRDRVVSRRSAPLETVDDLKRLLAYLRAEAARVERREPIDVMVAVGYRPGDRLDDLKRTLEEFYEAGAGWFTINVPDSSVEEARRTIDQLGACLVPI